MTEPPEDFIGAANASQAAEVARQAALTPPPRPQRATNKAGADRWLENALRGVLDDVRNEPEGNRNGRLRWGARRLGELSHGGLDEQECKRELEHAAQDSGIWSEDGPRACRASIASGWNKGITEPEDLSHLGQQHTNGRAKKPTPEQKKPPHTPDAPDFAKTLKLRKLSTVKSRVPMWVWTYNDKGRIQLGTLSMFAGKPSAGKSTAVRWFAARLSKGELPGVWFGHPMKVAVVMAEEQTDAVVVPGLVAAGADLQNVYTPEIKYGDIESGFKTEDMTQLQEELLDMQVRAVFIDPIMSTFGGKSDIYRNNEVREKLAPFTRLAGSINGIVVGVTHLTKGQIRDVLGGMNGSAAFGEVPRAVFGFAPIEDGNHVFEQVKNSAGEVGLKLSYQLPVSYLTADDGQPIELPRFEITGETEISIADINPNSDETTDIGTAKDWLKMYLLENQPTSSAQTKIDAKRNGDIQPWTLKRAMKELRVKIFSQSLPGKPHTTVWTLPDYGSNPL